MVQSESVNERGAAKRYSMGASASTLPDNAVILAELERLRREDPARATELVNAYKSAGREGHTRGGHMPEDRSQRRQIDKGEMQYKRGGHKAKQNG